MQSVPPLQIETSSPEQTVDLGRSLAALLEAGDVVALVGELGAGKTQLVRGVVEGLGGDGSLAVSPTYILMCEYPARVPVVHLDAYRMAGREDLDSIGFGPELLEGAVTLIEWADRIQTYLPSSHLRLELKHASESRRHISFLPQGAWETRAEALRGFIQAL